MSLSRFEKFTIKKQTQGLYKAMTKSILAIHDSNPGLKHESDYASLALTQRPLWKQTDPNIFEFRGGNVVRIESDDSILEVINKVLQVELVGKEAFDDMDHTLEIFEFAKSELDKLYPS